MMNVFEKKSVVEMYVQLSNGRLMLLEDLVKDYERLLRKEVSGEEVSEEEVLEEEVSEEEVPEEEVFKEEVLEEEAFEEELSKEGAPQKELTAERKVGEWFLIDRDVIDKNWEKIERVCGEERDWQGRLYRERFKEANKIADKYPEEYPRRGVIYIFKMEWEGRWVYINDVERMCERLNSRKGDEVIVDLELQMRICNGETVKDLFQEPDKHSHPRIIKSREGKKACLGSGTDYTPFASPLYSQGDIFIFDFSFCNNAIEPENELLYVFCSADDDNNFNLPENFQELFYKIQGKDAEEIVFTGGAHDHDDDSSEDLGWDVFDSDD